MLQINASIAKHDKNIWCVYRTKHLRHYDAEYFLTELDAELEPISDKRLFAENKNTAFEDIRLLSFGDRLLAFYNFLPFEENVGWKLKYEVGYGEIDAEKGIIVNQVSLNSLSKRFHEKNWSPYIYNGELFMVTEFDPFLRVIKIENTSGKKDLQEIYQSQNITTGWDFGELKGGTPLVVEPNANDGWFYGFIHSFRENETGFKIFYYYTVARFNPFSKELEYHHTPLPYIDEEPDDEYNLLWQLSNGKHCKVIFPIGIMQHDDGLMVSFGKDDVCSYTEHFSWDRIKAYFNN
ncbi:hypothetical protein [Mucilaginibacter sp. UYCu711]|uniref:hypothetical protein n=1 Tax=Mucilaginibacter sp. UYCu711 TaxID=3156339 RepID=UPI003D1E8563